MMKIGADSDPVALPEIAPQLKKKRKYVRKSKPESKNEQKEPAKSVDVEIQQDEKKLKVSDFYEPVPVEVTAEPTVIPKPVITQAMIASYAEKQISELARKNSEQLTQITFQYDEKTNKIIEDMNSKFETLENTYASKLEALSDALKSKKETPKETPIPHVFEKDLNTSKQFVWNPSRISYY